MLVEFKPSIGSTLFDLCLNTYLSLNLLPKFIKDNNVQNLDFVTGINEKYVYDTDFIYDEFLSNELIRNNYKFSTGDIKIPNSNVSNENYLLIESLAILQNEAGINFLI
jgi:hypothetical protein